MRLLTLFFVSAILLISSCSTSRERHEHSHPHDHSDPGHAHEQQMLVKDSLQKLTIPASNVSPEYIQLATNIEVIPNIKEAVNSVGVSTHEGIFGPLLFAEKTRAFFIELKAGMFLSEHPHPNESLVYTVEGRWVLCSEAKRQVMEAGSLFHFGSNMPTGWEAPFAEGALLLVVKTKEEGANYVDYIAGLKDMAASVDEDRKNGIPFYYNELEEDHPAIQFARSINPDFDDVLDSIEQ